MGGGIDMKGAILCTLGKYSITDDYISAYINKNISETYTHYYF